jgi:hypothetical protein
MDFCKWMLSQTNERSTTHFDLFESQLSRDLFDELNGIERFLTTEQIDSITLFTQIDHLKTISWATTPLDQLFFDHLRFLPFFSAQYWTNVVFPRPATANKANSSRMKRFVAFLSPVSTQNNTIDPDEMDSERNEEVRQLMRRSNSRVNLSNLIWPMDQERSPSIRPLISRRRIPSEKEIRSKNLLISPSFLFVVDVDKSSDRLQINLTRSLTKERTETIQDIGERQLPMNGKRTRTFRQVSRRRRRKQKTTIRKGESSSFPSGDQTGLREDFRFSEVLIELKSLFQIGRFSMI